MMCFSSHTHNLGIICWLDLHHNIYNTHHPLLMLLVLLSTVNKFQKTLSINVDIELELVIGDRFSVCSPSLKHFTGGNNSWSLLIQCIGSIFIASDCTESFWVNFDLITHCEKTITQTNFLWLNMCFCNITIYYSLFSRPLPSWVYTCWNIVLFSL